jgi:hypothetical protein
VKVDGKNLVANMPTRLFSRGLAPVRLMPPSLASRNNTCMPPPSWNPCALRPVHRSISSVSVASNDIDIGAFRQRAFTPGSPLLIRSLGHESPVAEKWFQRDQHDSSAVSLAPYVSQFNSALFAYELVRNSSAGGSDSYTLFQDWLHGQDKDLAQQLAEVTQDVTKVASDGCPRFYQFSAPLGLLSKAIEYNSFQKNEATRVRQLYIAQSQLNDLPEPLRCDLPVPQIVQQAGKGDIYDSSIWLGLEPTYTPLHRDPNPNLFVQMMSAKSIRLLIPSRGQQLYARVQQELGSTANSRFRGSEMMEGPERAALYEAVWGLSPPDDIQEAVLEPGDSLFIPKGWWHSVKSVFSDGRLNASANWWFR